MNISSINIEMFHFLIDHEVCNQQVLADERYVKKSTMLADIDKMEKMGLAIGKRVKKIRELPIYF